MSVLFVVQGFQETETVFSIAAKMAERGQIVFLFTQKGVRHLTDRRLTASLSYAGGINCLEHEGSGYDLCDGVTMIDYEGWVELIEASEKIVSWI
ncbi:MAG: hypothetical protein JSV27_02595 [Candidatus Bathyarchaeota archaeon]|nr:MAG: hypothetical protein JSV27_02595 [Candidatus Bathyarchaeota archaeon]